MFRTNILRYSKYAFNNNVLKNKLENNFKKTTLPIHFTDFINDNNNDKIFVNIYNKNVNFTTFNDEKTSNLKKNITLVELGLFIPSMFYSLYNFIEYMYFFSAISLFSSEIFKMTTHISDEYCFEFDEKNDTLKNNNKILHLNEIKNEDIQEIIKQTIKK